MAAVSHSTASSSPPAPASPPARRLGGGRWRDPRVWVGVLLVAGSVVIGGRLLAAADDTVDVWALSRDVPAGQPIGSEALEREQVHFADDTLSQHYLSGAQAPPAAAVATRDLAAGELLARSSVGDRDASEVSHLPVVVGAAGAPEDLGVGDVVDVWVVPPQSTDGSTAPATQVLTRVRVVSSDHESGPLGDAATRQVLLGLDEGAAGGLGDLLTSVSTGSVVLIRAGR
ncbi:MAG: hypothetical protein ACRDQB_01915 [Thermocrispum sp.]